MQIWRVEQYNDDYVKTWDIHHVNKEGAISMASDKVGCSLEFELLENKTEVAYRCYDIDSNVYWLEPIEVHE